MALANILNVTGAKKKSGFYLQRRIKTYFKKNNRFQRYKYSGKHLEVGVVLHIYIYTVDLQ